MSMSSRRSRTSLVGAAKELKEHADKRRGWQYDPRTGDAYMIVRPLVDENPTVGVIAYVRPVPDGPGFECIVKGNNPAVPRFPYDGVKPTAEEALKAVEQWLQRGIEGIAADAAGTEARKEALNDFRAFLTDKFGEEKTAVLWGDFLAFQASRLYPPQDS